MNLKNIGPAIRGLGVQSKYFVKDHSLQILTGTSIVTGVASVGLATYAAYKKIPAVQAKFDAALAKIQEEITAPGISATEELKEIGTERIEELFSSQFDNDPDVIEKREYINSLTIVGENYRQLEASQYTKARLQRAGRMALIFAPAAACLVTSIICQIAGLGISLKKIAIAGSVITSLTAELASTRKQLKAAKGEDIVIKDDMQQLANAKIESNDITDETALMKRRKELYTIIYDKHLLLSPDKDKCIEMAEAQLKNYESICNQKLNSPYNHPSDGIGRFYYGDVLKALIGETNECGQLTGWITRDYPSDYDGTIDFGCWIVDSAGVKRLNPNNIDENGAILLDFNVEGEVEELLREAKQQSSFRK